MSALDCASVYEFFARTAHLYPQRAFLQILPETAKTYGIAAGEMSYQQMTERVSAQASHYREAGYGKGHYVGLLVENRPEFLIHWFALNSLGAVIVPINPDLQIYDIEYLVNHSEMDLAVVTASRIADVRKAGRERNLAVIAPDELPRALRHKKDSDALTMDDPAALLYTSGTTGLPKGCVLSQKYFLHCGDWYQNIGGLCALDSDGERMLTPLPLFHMNALAYSVMAMLAVGGCLIVLDRFHPKSWWASVRDSRASVIHYLGVMPAMLMKLAESDEDRNHQVRFGFGAGVEPELHQPFEARFGFSLIEAWAMTETGSGGVIAASREPRHIGTRCFGTPQAGIEVKIESDSGDEAGVDEPGELLIRREGANPRLGFFSRYLKDKAATDEAWQGGWFHTGDIVKKNADGTLCFVDRKKNVIRRSGENIAAVEVEAALLRHPEVAAIAVAPVPDALRGDEVFACIIPQKPVAHDERQAFAEQLTHWGLERLAYYKLPCYYDFVEALPMTATNKIRRGELKTQAEQSVNSPDIVSVAHLKKRKNRS